jgi:hypothetical protein
MVALRKSPTHQQAALFDDRYLRGLEPVAETHERRHVFMPNGMSLACHEDAPEIVAYRRIGEEWYPYTAVMIWRRWNSGGDFKSFRFLREVQR